MITHRLFDTFNRRVCSRHKSLHAAESPEWIRRHTVSALIAAGYQF